MAEKSKGLAGIPAPGREPVLLCPDGDSPEDVSEFVTLFSVEPGFSSKKDITYTINIPRIQGSHHLHTASRFIINRKTKKKLIQTNISKLVDKRKVAPQKILIRKTTLQNKKRTKKVSANYWRKYDIHHNNIPRM